MVDVHVHGIGFWSVCPVIHGDTRTLIYVQPTLQGVEAVDALLEATPETPSYMIGLRENSIIRIPLMEAVAQTKAVADAIEQKDFEKAMSYRDPEFVEALEGFVAVSALDHHKKLPKEKVPNLDMNTPRVWKLNDFFLFFSEDASSYHAVSVQ